MLPGCSACRPERRAVATSWPDFHTARSTAFLQPQPGTAPQPGPVRVPDDKLRGVLCITTVQVKRGTRPLAVTDSERDEA